MNECSAKKQGSEEEEAFFHFHYHQTLENNLFCAFSDNDMGARKIFFCKQKVDDQKQQHKPEKKVGK